MELGKYKLAMRPKKYLTREFVVYKAAPEAMDDVITEEQNTIDTMPSQAPAMDNYMPEIPGMEDPSLRQVELADGGIVERQGYSFAGLVKETKNKLINESNPQKKFQLKQRLNVLENLQKKSKNIQGAKFIENLLLKKDKLGRPYFSDYIEKLNVLEDLQTNQYINQKTNKPFTPQEWLQAGSDYRGKFRDPKTFLEKKKEYQKQYMKQRKESDPEYKQELLKKQKEKYYSKERANRNVTKKIAPGKEVLIEQRNRLLFYMSKAAKDNPNYKDIIKEGKFVGVFDKENNINYYEAGYEGKLGKNSKLITEHPDYNDVNNLAKLADRFKRELPNKAIASYFSAYERVPKLSEMYNFLQSDPRFVEKMSPRFFQTNPLHLHHQISVTESPSKKIQLLLQDRNDQAGKKLIEFKKGNITEQQLNKDLKKLNTRYYINGKPLGAMETSPETQLRTAKSQTTKLFKKRLQENPELIEQMTKRLNINLSPAEKKAISNFGTKLSSFGGGVDPDTIKQVIQGLPAEQRNLIFGAANKLRGLSKFGLRALAELTTGTGALGMGITAVISAPLLVDKLGEGYSLGQSLQDLGNVMTLDTIKGMNVDRSMIEKFGGPTAAEGYDIIILAEKIADIQNKLLQLDEQQNQFESDPQYAKLVGKEELYRIQRRRKFLSDELANMEKQYQAIPDKFEKYTDFEDIKKFPELEKNIRKREDVLYEPFSLAETVMGFDDPRQEEEAQKIIKTKKLLKKFEYEKPKQKQPLKFWGGVDTYKAIPPEELINQYLAYGGRVGLKDAGDPKDKPILPINPMIGGEDPRGSLQDPGRRDVLKGMGLLGAGVAAGKLGLLKLGKAIKKAPLTNIVKPMGKTMTQFPKWFPTLINRIRKEGTQIPIFKTKDVNISKQEYDALKQQGTKNLFDRYIGRTENYVNELKQQGIPRYYQKVNTDEIIGYKYEVKDLPNVRVTDLAGKEIRIDFPNAYGKDVTMTYKAPKVSVDMQGKKVKYDAEFQVDDAVPESGGYPGDVPDFYGEIVNNLDEVYGGASQIEQYALKLKKPRTTQGDEVVNAWDAGQPHMSVKEIRELELKKQKKQGRRDYAKQQVDEKPATFEDREFLKNFLDAGDDID